MMLASAASAQTVSETWDGGGGDDNWSAQANWTNDTVPINQFVDFAGTVRTNPQNDIAAGKYIWELRLKNTISGQNFTLDGNRVNVHNAIRTYDVAAGNITDVINMDVATLNGNWVIGTNHDLTMNGVISNWNTNNPLIKSGTGTLTLSGANTYTGGTTVNSGTLDLVGQNRIGGALTVDGTWRKNWAIPTPFAGHAIAVCKNAVVVAGVPLKKGFSLQDTVEAFDGKKGGVAWILNRTTGEPIQKIDLPAPPSWDSIALANNTCVISLKDGSVVSFATK